MQKLLWTIIVILMASLLLLLVNLAPKWPTKKEDRLPKLLEYKYGIKHPTNQILADIYRSAGDYEDIDPALLIAISAVESSMNHKAVSPDGSTGYMGVQPKYWKTYKVTDQYENIYAGAQVLRTYIDQTGEIDDAVIAYNIGITSFNKRKNIDRGEIYLQKVTKEYVEIQQLLAAPTTSL